MRTRSEIEMSSDYQLERAETDLSTYPHARLGQLQLEVLLDIRDLLSHSRSAAQQELDASVERSAVRTIKRAMDEVSRGS